MQSQSPNQQAEESGTQHQEVGGEQQQQDQGIMGVWLPEGYYVLHPQWKDYWDYLCLHIADLNSMNPPHITQIQRAEYYRYLADLYAYLFNFIYSGQHIHILQYEQTITEYREKLNPEGAKIFDKQEAYFAKLAGGGTNTKATAKPSSKPTTQKVYEKKEESEPIRKDDPKINIEELVKTKWDPVKYPNVSELVKPNVNMIFIGHVDAGKSTLSGRLLKNLKMVDEQELKRNEQQAKSFNRQGWELSYNTDILEDEKKKGKTLECSKTLISLQKRRYTLFDAPGHKNYVPNMILGACQADLAVLIVSAKEGEYESGFDKEGQTKEHAMLARALGVTSLFCAVTKMECVDWSEERFNKIKSEVSLFLKNACGYNDVKFVPIDSIVGTNIDVRDSESVCKWYNGECFCEALENAEVLKRSSTAALRIPIIDKFKEQGNLYVFGKLESGALVEDQTVSLLPRKQYFNIKEIFNAKDERLPYALAGENVKLKVKLIEEEEVVRGNIICNNLNYCQVCYEFQARLTVLELPEKKLISPGYECIIHLHAVVDGAEIIAVEAVETPDKKLVKSTFLRSGQVGMVRIRVNVEVCLQKCDFMEGLGRFTLRDEGKTIGFGEVLKIKPSQNLTAEQKAQLVGVDKLKVELESKLKVSN